MKKPNFAFYTVIGIVFLNLFFICKDGNSQVVTEDLVIGKQYTFHTVTNNQYTGIIKEMTSEDVMITAKDNKTYKIKFNQISYIESDDMPLLSESVIYYTIKTTDDNEIEGKIVKKDSTFFYLQTPSGVEIKIPRSSILSITKSDKQVIKGKYVERDPNGSRLFISPTARPVGNFKGYFSVAEIFFPMITFGITNYVTLSGGMSLFPGAGGQMIYTNLKVTPLQINNFDAAAGIMYTGVTTGSDWSAGIVYGLGTTGTKDNSFTFGAGFTIGKNVSKTTPMLLFGGEVKIENGAKLISENWLIFEEGSNSPTFFSGGVRFYGKKVAGDFGLIYFTNLGLEKHGFPFFPYLSFTYNFSTQ